ncbi:T9SS type A sorting domain-containing protein [uncultured Porphyromonas sp.]|uniref:InlB B-repeat-containing protein n=1 Tax=uncultured Porphyromonas sp. TaxID=159274 RepID=UPI00261D95AA|nr:T9SS type A sorting domain-containing protein [uncultured Porphyromonas sp.]
MKVEFEQFVARFVKFEASPAEGGDVTVVNHELKNISSGDVVPDGSKITVYTQNKDGYVFDYWEIDGVHSDEKKEPNIFDYKVTKDVSFKAFFRKLVQIPVTFNANGAGSVEGKMSGTKIKSGKSIQEGTYLRFIAMADNGAEFRNWTINGVDTLAGMTTILYKVLKDKDNTIVANFESTPIVEYSVTFAADPFEAGKVTATYAEGFSAVDIVSGNKVPAGKYVTFVAEAYAGYEFEKFTVNGLDAPVDYTNPEQYATELSGDLNVVAHFKSTAPAEEYTVTFAADPKEGGTITATYYDKANEKEVPFETGAKFSGDENYLTFTAKANDGYQIVSWSANGKDVTPSDPKKIDKLEYQAKEALDLKVVFKKVYPLTLTATKGGSLLAKVGDKVVKSGDKVTEGTKVTIEATPKEGYELTALTAGTEDILAAKSFVMKGATEVKATFTKLQKNYVVTLKSNDHGTITIKEKVDLKAVPEGTKLTVVAKGANDKCELTKLTANGEDILKDNTFTVTKDTEVIAEFVDHTDIDAVAADAFVIYPNPASESATVTGLAPEAAVALYTLDGQLITRLAADRSGRLQIDLTALSDGTYLVVTEGATQRLVVKH